MGDFLARADPLTFAGWPHLVDVLLRTRRAEVGTTPGEIVWREVTRWLEHHQKAPAG
jgi:hypothetical protein